MNEEFKEFLTKDQEFLINELNYTVGEVMDMTRGEQHEAVELVNVYLQ